jgi:hypothetical protein
MVARREPDALDCGIEFALTQMGDDDIIEIAAGSPSTNPQTATRTI